MQIVANLAYPTPVTEYSIAYDGVSTDIYTDWLQIVVGQPNLPPTISTSYGGAEAFDDYTYASRMCTEFMELGAQGISILFSSGDSGTSDRGICALPDNQGYAYVATNPAAVNFVADSPGGCPYITMVGATKFYDTVPYERAVFETFVPTYTSGGGFSNYFPQPAYQKQAVDTYLANPLTQAVTPYFNPRGRAYPDVAAMGGITYPTYTGEYQFDKSNNPDPYLSLFGGTSVSSPVFASLIALINDMRIKSKLPTLGFLNPALYSAPSNAFNDITSGFNYGCGPEGLSGFNATAGWDAVTGLGMS